MDYPNVSLSLDAQGRPLYGWLPFTAVKRMTFAGGTLNDPGDYDGSGNPATLFRVTGDVWVYLVAFCKTDLAGANATIEAGIAGNTAILLPLTTGTGIDVNMMWKDASPALGEAFTPAIHGIGGGLDIIQTLRTANLTGGVLDYYCFWRPLSSDGLVIPA